MIDSAHREAGVAVGAGTAGTTGIMRGGAAVGAMIILGTTIGTIFCGTLTAPPSGNIQGMDTFRNGTGVGVMKLPDLL
jgi:hypothetical protein